MKAIAGNIYSPDFQFHRGKLFIENDTIVKVEYTTPSTDDEDCYVIPGLIDIHFHGCMGNDFCDGTLDSLEEIARHEASWGVTGICPASMTLPPEKLSSIVKNAHDFRLLQSSCRYRKNACDSNMTGSDSGRSNCDSYMTGSDSGRSICASAKTSCYSNTPISNSNKTSHSNKTSNDSVMANYYADFLGIHLEGPFLSFSKKGAQNAAYLRKPDITLFQQFQDISDGLIKLVDVAPEEEGALAFIRHASSSCAVSLAHTAADYHTCMKAFQAGATHVTHLFNAMTPFSHREPGLPGAAFDTPDCDVELICDGIHLSPAAVRMAFRLFTEERIILISDSMMATGMPDGTYTLGGQFVTVRGNLATLADSTIPASAAPTADSTTPASAAPTADSTTPTSAAPTVNSITTISAASATGGTIAGSATHLADCVRKAVSFGIPLESAIRCATANPARSIGCDDSYGFLKPGYTANVVILGSDLSLKNVILRGVQII